MSTRPRITFDDRGWCNACCWAEQKRTLDWSSREQELLRLLDRHRSAGARYDCIVPVSGGKDGSYVAHSLKHRYGMSPLSVSVTPPLPLELGERNLRAFTASGYPLVVVNTPPDTMRELDTVGFKEMGFPYYGWLIAIHTAVLRVAHSFDIPLIFYSEDGEVEYGGTTETAAGSAHGIEYQRRVYLEGGYDSVLARSASSAADQWFFTFPSDEELHGYDPQILHWSYFENWDPYRNYLVAKAHCGLAENEDSNPGTFTNFAQNDQTIYALHTYLMYLKFGFGRANQDACIEVRRGAMERAQAVNLVRLYDGQFPEESVDEYLAYYRMERIEFDAVLDRWANKDLFEKRSGRWTPLFEIE